MIQFVERLSKNELVLYLLHGVIEKQSHLVRNYTRKHILAEELDTFLKLLKKKGTALSIDEATDLLKKKKIFPEYSYVITFDDGFENNLTVAAPVLESHSIPAVFYISTDFIENNTMSWIDQIEYAVERIDKSTVTLPWNKEKISFNNKDTKIAFLDKVRHDVKKDPNTNTASVVKDFYNQWNLDVIYKNTDALDQKLNWQQVKALQSNRLFTVGGHSHHHLNLAFIPHEEMKKEIRTSLNLIREKAGIHCQHYAYPEGLKHCYSENVIYELKENNIVCSPTAIDGTNSVGADPFHLKRIFVN